MTEFQEFPKIARLNREIVVTEKIDGTNASVYIGADGGEFLVGSRTRWITPEADNHGFARWAHGHEEELRTLGPGHHYGEWWGSGIQRGYGLEKGEKRFSLFNVERWGDARKATCRKCHLTAATWAPEACARCGEVRPPEPPLRPACCGVVPTLLRATSGIDIAARVCLEHLSEKGSAAAPGFMKPEGIVIYHAHSRGLFKVTIEKDEEHKGKAAE
jgi:hypothetical protein